MASKPYLSCQNKLFKPVELKSQLQGGNLLQHISFDTSAEATTTICKQISNVMLDTAGRGPNPRTGVGSH
jgi:hypothetical protein